MINQLQKEINELKKQLQTNMQFDDLISEEFAAKWLGCSIWTLRKMRYDGKLKKWYTLNGKNIMVSKFELINLLKKPI